MFSQEHAGVRDDRVDFRVPMPNVLPVPTVPSPADDSLLVARLQGGDPVAEAELAQRFAERLVVRREAGTEALDERPERIDGETRFDQAGSGP